MEREQEMTQEFATTELKTELVRHQCNNTEDLKEHIKAVGRSILEDADKLSIDPKYTRSVRMYANIESGTEITTVEWTIERIADPRLK